MSYEDGFFWVFFAPMMIIVSVSLVIGFKEKLKNNHGIFKLICFQSFDFFENLLWKFLKEKEIWRSF